MSHHTIEHDTVHQPPQLGGQPEVIVGQYTIDLELRHTLGE